MLVSVVVTATACTGGTPRSPSAQLDTPPASPVQATAPGDTASDTPETSATPEILSPETPEKQPPPSYPTAGQSPGLATSPSGPLTYPWGNVNTFFGWSIIGKDKIPYVQELDMKWASLQPHVFWFEIEHEKGRYDWAELDEEVAWLQQLDVDITFVYSSFGNIYDEGVRQQIREELLDLLGQPGIGTLQDAWISWNRDMDGPARYGMMPDPFDEDDPMMKGLLAFIRALVERYDGDGVDDWDGLRYPVRVHHVVEEWPGPAMDARTYLGLLSELSPVIKEADPNAKVMIPGLYMPNWGRVFAYLDGYIDDPDAGIVRGVKYTWAQLNGMPGITFAKKAYETILDLGRDYFDLVDIHLYTEKETFYEGEIEYVLGKMRELGYEKPIWCVEGGGPFRNPENSPNDAQGDSAFGTTNEKEVAEYVVKFHAMSAALGLERQHWGIGGQNQQGYWGGPWNIMGLLEKGTERKRPAYYSYWIMREKLRDFTVGNVADLSVASIRIFQFSTPRGIVYVAWDADGTDQVGTVDLSGVLGHRDVKVAPIVTQLNTNNGPIVPEASTHSSANVPLSITPVFIE